MKQHPIYTHLFLTESGEVWSNKTKKFLKQRLHKNGYWTLSTKLEGRKSPAMCFKVHRLVAQTYLPNPKGLPQVNHIDGNKQNNHLSNLEWVTNKENYYHAKSLGLTATPPSRDNNPQSKLTTFQLESIAAEYKPHSREHGIRALSRKYGVAHSTLSRLVSKM